MSASRLPSLLARLRSGASDLSGRAAGELLEGASLQELGFDSLMLTQLAQAYQREFGVRITFRMLSDDYSTLGALARHLDATLPADAAPSPAPSATRATTAPPEPARSTLPAGGPGTADTVRAANADIVQAVVLQQLRIMEQQLAVLRGTRTPATTPDAATDSDSAATSAPATPADAAARVAVPVPTSPVVVPVPEGAPSPTRSGAAALTPHQHKRLDSLVARYTARTARSKALAQRHRAVHADPRTAAGFNRRWKEMVYPIVVERSSGATLWDVDGNSYVDLLNGFGPNLLGHSPPFITEALRAQLDRGVEVGPMTPLAGEVAALVCELTGMDRASLVCTGSEAVQAAIRCSRTVTGRDRIVVFSRDYHGNFDEVLVRGANAGDRLRTMPSVPGIPTRAVEDVIVLDYATDESLEVIRRHADTIAAVIVEPVQSRRPELQPREYLHALRALTEERGIVLVFDEVVTGFRCHQGGAQAHFGVRADLATYGKVLGGGMPFGVVAGRSRFMDTFDGGPWAYGDDSHPQAGVTFFAGTFVRHPLAVVAAHATLTYLRAAGPALQAQLNETTTAFATKVNAVLGEHDLPFALPHFGSQLYLRHTDDNELAALLPYHLRLRGVHLLEGFPTYLTVAHGEAELDHVVRAFREGVEEMLEAGFFRRRARRPVSTSAAATPPVPGARLGRDPDGRPAWYVPDPERPSAYVRLGAAS